MKQVFINIVGHNSSGKSTLANKLLADYSLSKVSGDEFRKFVHEQVRYFHDTDMSYPNERYSELNPLVIQYRLELSWILLRAKQSVVYDGSGSTKKLRARYLAKIATEFPYVTRVLIWADLPEEELLKRLSERGGTWKAQYDDIKKHSFEPPEAFEADVVLRYDQHNYAEIRESIEQLLV